MVELYDAFTVADGGWMFSRAVCPECSRVCRERSVPLGSNAPRKLLRQGLSQMETYPDPLVTSAHFRCTVCPDCSTLAAEAALEEESVEDLGEVFRASVALRVLEEVWSDIRSQVEVVPDAVMVLASGVEDVKGTRWGHWAASRWRVTVEGELRAEVMVAGEGLTRGAVEVMGTLLHEAAHGIAYTQEEQDTSRQGRYHNKVFKRNAEGLGLEVARDRHGWSKTSLVMTGRNDRWWWAIRRLEAVCALGERVSPGHRGATVSPPGVCGTSSGRVDGGADPARVAADEPVVSASLTNGRRFTLSCGCSPVRKIRVVASVASLGEITCGVCALPFRSA